MRKLVWTPKQREIYSKLQSGLSPKDILAQGYGRTSVYRVKNYLDAGKGPDSSGNGQNKDVSPGRPLSSPSGSPLGEHQYDSRVRIRTLDPVEVGGLYIEPADWRINQYGGFLIMNTHNFAREKFGYEGSVGDFICDAVQVLRTVMGLDIMSFEYLIKEDNHGGGEEESDQGGNIPEEAGDEPGGESGDEER